MLFFVLLLISFILIYIYLRKVNQYWEYKNIPHVKPWLLFGNIGKLIFQMETQANIVQDIYNSHDSRYVGMHSLLTPVLLLKDLELIKQIGIREFDHFGDHKQFINEKMDPLFGRNLFGLTGQKWRNMRSNLSPAFTSNKMRGIFILMSECAQQYRNYFAQILTPNEPSTIDLKDIFSRFANDTIASAAFGVQCNSIKEKGNEFYSMGTKITDFGGARTVKFFAFQCIPFVMKCLKSKFIPEKAESYFKSIIEDNIRCREEQGIIRQDMIHLLLEARKGRLKHEDDVQDEGAGFATVEESEVGKQKIDPEYLSNDDITAQALVFFFAGFDTLSTALSHIVYELTLNQNIQEKLQKEIDEVSDKCNGTIDYDNIVEMKYLDMVVSEGLRKWPPLPAIDRACTDRFTIQPEKPGEVPVTLEKGDAIWFPMYALHRDPKYFPDPDKFDPERFNEENRKNIVPYSYIPFGIGPRNCIGSRFALLEAKTLLCHMLSKFSFVVVEKTEIPIKITKKSFRLIAENGFWVGIKLRDR